MLRSVASSSLVALVLLHARVALAGPELELDWQAPAQCPDAAAARERIDLLVGEAAGASSVRAEVRITEAEHGYRMTLRTDAAAAGREIASDDCRELADTAALIVAIAIDPGVLDRIDDERAPAEVPMPPVAADAADGQPSTAAARETSAPAIANERAGALPVPPSRPRERQPARLVGRVVAGLGVGTLPAPTAELAASLGIAWARARVELESAYAVRRPMRSRNNDDVGVLAQQWSAGVRGCGVLARGRVEAPLCGIVRAGLLHARGDGALRPRTTELQPWVGVGPGAALLVRLRPRLALAFGVDALVAAVTGGFRTEPSGAVRAPWPVSLHAWAGIQWTRVTGRERGGQPGR